MPASGSPVGGVRPRPRASFRVPLAVAPAGAAVVQRSGTGEEDGRALPRPARGAMLTSDSSVTSKATASSGEDTDAGTHLAAAVLSCQARFVPFVRAQENDETNPDDAQMWWDDIDGFALNTMNLRTEMKLEAVSADCLLVAYEQSDCPQLAQQLQASPADPNPVVEASIKRILTAEEIRTLLLDDCIQLPRRPVSGTPGAICKCSFVLHFCECARLLRLLTPATRTWSCSEAG
eukprot:SAG31_NODE_7543_length_1659_cov_1.958333_2_plen_234_part_00